MSVDYLLAIDQGTTSTRAIVFDAQGLAIATAQRELPQIFPHPGWVEHDPETIWRDCVEVCRDAVVKSGIAPASLAGIGITNQRETTVLWDKATGIPIYNAIVWQDRRTAPLCARLKSEGMEAKVTAKTGLLLDPYFSATKIAWLLDNIEGARARAESGAIIFGTIDSYLVWQLTGGARHVTDVTNASRTMLFDIFQQDWDSELLEIFNIPRAILPDVFDNTAMFGETRSEPFNTAVPILGMVGDQQSAAIGQACLSPGMIKSTYGTGCFALLNTGKTVVGSTNKLLTTIAYRFDSSTRFALEGSIFVAGAAVQWLRDGLGIIRNSAETSSLAETADPKSGVYLVPAFTGLGAPYWDSGARANIQGLTRDSGKEEIARATLESIGFQTRDLFQAMAADGAAEPTTLRVDGGLSKNDWAMQFLADILAIPVERPVITEITALGAAYLAGLQAGIYTDLKNISENWAQDRFFEPSMSTDERDQRYSGWCDAVQRTRTSIIHDA
ncbi:MAG: Glycerol kinase [Alphaproteobacteria bacterium MarineAlpha4_Bin2]|nr:MAG: Glycerol kinase [Alphaproteobacteria bacterium MarineAlpha4_Bin2]